MTELAELVGQHVLQHTPRTDVVNPLDTSSNGIGFVLDNKTYLAFEDPSDGYRSSMGGLYVADGDQFEWVKADGLRLPVLCSIRTKSEYGAVCEILEMRKVSDGKLVLTLGTNNTEDYYPSFVCSWTPPELAQ